MKKLILILISLSSTFLYAQEAETPKETSSPAPTSTKAIPSPSASLDVSNPDERYIESQDGSVRLDGTQIDLWNSACEFFELAITAYDEKNYDDALLYIDQAVTYAPEEIYEKWSMYILKGDILRALGKYKDAREAFFKVSNEKDFIGVRQAQALYKIGLSHYEEENWANAHPYFERVYIAYLYFEYYSSRSFLYDAKCFEYLNRPKDSLKILHEYLRLSKDKDNEIYKRAEILQHNLRQKIYK